MCGVPKQSPIQGLTIPNKLVDDKRPATTQEETGIMVKVVGLKSDVDGFFH